MSWIDLWKWLLIVSMAAYALLAIVVTWRGAGDARAMLASLLRRQQDSGDSR